MTTNELQTALAKISAALTYAIRNAQAKERAMYEAAETALRQLAKA